MKQFSVAITLFLSIMVNSRVLLNRHKNEPIRRNLYTTYPRYLVPNPAKEILEASLPETQEPSNKIELDHRPQERKLFMMTDYEAQKKRFGQRMKCRIYNSI